MATATVNPHEQAARWRKAALIAAALQKCGCDAEDARMMTRQEWIHAAELADVHLPSSATRALVIEILEGRHAA